MPCDCAVPQRVIALPEARAAPAHPDLAADGPQHIGDRFAPEPRVRALDRVLHRARAGEDDEVRRGLRVSRVARVADDECRLEEIVVAAVRARADVRLIERQVLGRDRIGRERVAWREGLRDHRYDLG